MNTFDGGSKSLSLTTLESEIAYVGIPIRPLGQITSLFTSISLPAKWE